MELEQDLPSGCNLLSLSYFLRVFYLNFLKFSYLKDYVISFWYFLETERAEVGDQVDLPAQEVPHDSSNDSC